MTITVEPELLPRIRTAQRSEITEYAIYRNLARMARGPNAGILERIARDEKRHHDFWERITGRAERPARLRVAFYTVLARLLGLTFAFKLMERGEDFAQGEYERLAHIPGVDAIIHDEEDHEHELIAMLEDEPLEYAGSIVLGLNDALVELTGALAGLTLALADGRIVATAGLVTGLAASLSMAASEYLSSKSEADAAGTAKNPLKAAVYTGTAYVLTVILLIAPFFLLGNVYAALGTTLAIAVVIIALFTAYIGVARDLAFWPRFLEMTGISLGVALISFGIGWAARALLGPGAAG